MPDVLAVLVDRVHFFPKVGEGSKSKGKANEALFTEALLKCLTSSQSETRALAEDILRECIKVRAVRISTAEKAASKLINAERRKVQPILDRIGSIPVEAIPLEQSLRKNTDQPTTSAPSRNYGCKSPGRPKSSASFQRTTKESPARTKITSPRSSLRSRDRNSLSRRKRSMSRSRRESAAGSKQGSDVSSILADLMSDPAFHPLTSETAIKVSKSHRINKQREHLPEYPEEPSGKDVFSDLKRTWAPLLPHASVELLFPANGIRVQDDASIGCELLSRGTEMIIESGDENVIINQIDLIIRWFSYALCSRETTKGMQSLISFLIKLATVLRNEQYQLTDSESLRLLPYLLEKAGAAKVSKDEYQV